MKKLISLATLILLGGCTVNIPKIPLEDFFKNPEKSSFQLSPNGEQIAYMKPWEDGNRMMNVYIKNLGDENGTRITSASKRSL